MKTPSHPSYQGAYDLFYPSWGSALPPEQAEKAKQEWIDFIEGARVLTKDIYDEMTDDEQRRYRVGAWGTIGGITVSTTGEAFKMWDSIRARYRLIARSNAIQARVAAGFQTGERNDYLITPTGRTTTYNGQSLGEMTMPHEIYDRGMWDGVLTAGVKFTK